MGIFEVVAVVVSISVSICDTGGLLVAWKEAIAIVICSTAVKIVDFS